MTAYWPVKVSQTETTWTQTQSWLARICHPKINWFQLVADAFIWGLKPLQRLKEVNVFSIGSSKRTSDPPTFQVSWGILRQRHLAHACVQQIKSQRGQTDLHIWVSDKLMDEKQHVEEWLDDQWLPWRGGIHFLHAPNSTTTHDWSLHYRTTHSLFTSSESKTKTTLPAAVNSTQL